jgi:phosphate:Na+ symporter
MKHLLDLLAAVALLIWGTHLVRTGILTSFGSALRDFLARNVRNRWAAFAAGLGVTTLVQSSTATALIASSFVGQSLLSLPLALAVMLGADVGTSLIVALFSFNLSWLSPFLIFGGVVMYLWRQTSNIGRLGRVAIGLGLMLMALRLVSVATGSMTHSLAVQGLLSTVANDVMLAITVGAALSVAAYSSLAIVLLTATLASSGVISADAAVGLMLGANVGSGLLAVLTTAKSEVEERQVPLGNLVFKCLGVLVAAPFVAWWTGYAQAANWDAGKMVVATHVGFNIAVAALFISLTEPIGRLVQRMLPTSKKLTIAGRPHHLDSSALGIPSIAIACAAREAMHQADAVETMLVGALAVIKNNDLELAHRLRSVDDTVDELYSAIKHYLIQIPREALGEDESKRWAEIMSFTINMEQVADIIERVLIDVEDRKISRERSFSEAGNAEVSELHALLIASLRLGMSVFLNGSVRDAQKLMDAKVRFRDLERAYSAIHLQRLSGNTRQSVETSSLHLDLLSELKRINSHICSIAYPVLEAANEFKPVRVRHETG